jgi:hypothetical protein
MAALIMELVMVTASTDTAPISVLPHFCPAGHDWGFSTSLAGSQVATYGSVSVPLPA